MASQSQGTTVTFDGSALAEVISVSATKTSEAAAANNDNRLDVSHLGLAVGADRVYLDAPLVDVPVGDTGDGAGDVSVEMYGSPPAAGATGSMSVSGGGMSFSASCVKVTSSGISLSVGEAARASVTFTIVPATECE
jgi:hypothetical protein